ncbi:MAG: stage III sporulation AC/AD family protein [Clostridia bacterium]|nr:stage III sporulation AC/AD family protein [Clostridia bacterium]
MQWIRLIGFCLLAAAMVMMLRQMNPAVAGLLSVAFGALVVGMVLPGVKAYIETIQSFLNSLDLDAEYYRIMLKAMGIVLVTQMAVQICRDMDAPSIARRAELCGRIALLGVAMPVFITLTQMAVDVLR